MPTEPGFLKGEKMAAKTPTTVITGFLGAGKTTLIRHMLANANGRRIALIINEFGDLGVDGEILKGCGDETCTEDDVVELSNGCICCTVAQDFIPTMQQLLARDDKPDHIVIETSGLALPQPLVRAFNWPEIATQVTVDSVITVVDGKAANDGQFAANPDAIDALRAADENLDHETPLSELFEDQIACADMIVVNKCDLLADAAAEALTGNLAKDARKNVRVVKSSHGVLPVDVLLGQKAGAEANLGQRSEVHHHHHDDEDAPHVHDHDEFESFVVDCEEISDPAAFSARISEIVSQHGILRVKGFASVTGKPMRLAIQAVGPRVESYFDRPLTPSDERGARLVVIGQAGLDQAAIAAGLSG